VFFDPKYDESSETWDIEGNCKHCKGTGIDPVAYSPDNDSTIKGDDLVDGDEVKSAEIDAQSSTGSTPPDPVETAFREALGEDSPTFKTIEVTPEMSSELQGIRQAFFDASAKEPQS
jgi:hypothetical protein